MTAFTPLCAFALLAAAPEGGTISITSTSPEAAADYVEAFDQLFAGHADLSRAAANKALSRDPGLLLAQALLYSITPGVESMKKVDAAAEAGASLPEAERTELAAWAANKHADSEKARALQLKLLELAPVDGYSPSCLPSAGAGPALRRLVPAEHGGGKGRGMNGAHRQLGLFVLAGAGVRPAGQLAPADIVDVLPTLLALAGEPVPGGLDGRPIAGALDAEPRSAPDPLPEAALAPRPFEGDETRALAARLAALGYLEPQA